MAKHNVIGQIGEELSCRYFIKKNWRIVEKNYRKKFGEIDIIARDSQNSIHFIEVKSVSYETKIELDKAVTHETWRPEEMLHYHKQERFKRVIEVWLLENDYLKAWQIDLITIRLVPSIKYAQLKHYENLIFE